LDVSALQLGRWQEKGYLVQLKRGIYLFADRQNQISGFTIAQLLYQPSYISLQTALFEYGIIPDVTGVITSVTTKATRSYARPFGAFDYRSIKADLFWGYSEVSTGEDRYLLADPQKAILDFLYYNAAQIRSKEDILGLRLDPISIRDLMATDKFVQYQKAYANPKIDQLVELLGPC